MYSTEEEIQKALQDYMAEAGGMHASWYVGTCEHPRTALFGHHRVEKDSDWWMFKRAASPEEARDVRHYFVRVLGTDGWADGTEQAADYVYAYRKSAHTCP